MGSILLKLLNRLLDVAVLLTLLVTALYCVYCIWDNNTIYDAPLKLQQELTNIGIRSQVIHSGSPVTERKRKKFFQRLLSSEV